MTQLRRLTSLSISALLSMLVLASCATQSGSQLTSGDSNASNDKIFNLPYTMKELDNGLRVVIVETDYPDLVSVHIPVQTGSRNEVEEGKSGFAHFFEHMMFKGTDKYPREDYERILKNAGADGNAYTSDDLTNYYYTFPKEHLEKVIELEADKFQNLTFTESVFRTEALAVKGEYLKNFTNPIRKIFAEVRELAYDVHPYQHTTMGYLRDIEKMPDQMEYSKTFFKRWYSPQFTTVIIAGDVDTQQTLDWVKQYWGDWQRAENDVVIPNEPEQTASRYRHKQVDKLPNTYVLTTFHAPALVATEKDKPALDLLSTLYFSSTSDLYQELVMQKQWVDQFWSYYPNRKDPTLFMVMARVKDGKNAQDVYNKINATIAKARVELADKNKLAELKSNLRYQFANAMDSSSSIASTLASYTHFERDPEIINRMYATLNNISVEDIREAANKYLVDARRVTVTMSAEESLANFNDAVSIDQQVAALQSATKSSASFKLVDKTNNSDLIDISWLFHAGAADDPKGKKGLTNFMAAMMTGGGSESMSYQDIQKAMFPLAGSFGYQIDKEMLVFRGRIHKDNLDEWYRIVSEQLLNPGWREDDFKRIKDRLVTAVKNDLKASNDEELGKEVLYAELYKGHPYESYNGGHVSDIESITLDELKAHYQRLLTQNRLTLGITGNISDEFKRSMTSDLAQLPVGNQVQKNIPDAPSLKGRHATIVDKTTTTSTAVSFGFPIDVNRSHEDFVGLWLMRSWLGEHRNSNSYLFQRIRAARGMNYGDYAYIEYFPRGMFQSKPDANLGRSEQIFQVWIRPLRSNNDALFATRTALYEIDKMLKNGMTQEQFESTRNFLYNYAPQLVGDQSKLLGYELDSQYYGTGDFVQYIRDGLNALTLDKVNAIIRKHIQMDNIHFVFVSPKAKELQSMIANQAETPLQYNSEKPDDIVTEDKVIQSYPLSIPKRNITVVNVDSVFQ